MSLFGIQSFHYIKIYDQMRRISTEYYSTLYPSPFYELHISHANTGPSGIVVFDVFEDVIEGVPPFVL